MHLVQSGFVFWPLLAVISLCHVDNAALASLISDVAHIQARPEHSVVLRANTGSSLAGDHHRVSSCTLLLRYIKPHDEFSPPDLTVELDNPQVLLLFRCGVLCLLHGIDFLLQRDVCTSRPPSTAVCSVLVLPYALLPLDGAGCAADGGADQRRLGL